MKLPLLFGLLAATATTVSAQFEQLQRLLNPIPRAPAASGGQNILPVPGVVYPIDTENYRELLQNNDLDWLVLFTTGPESCPGCVLYETTFNESIVLLQDNKKIHFGIVDCDTQAVLCSIFGAWGSRIYHVTHSDKPSKAFPGMTDHTTHLHPVPFHRPGTESQQQQPVDSNGQPIKNSKPPPPPPDAKWLSEVINEEKWKGFEEWTGYSHPFDGSMQILLYQWWWVVGLFSKVPPMAMMVGIGLLSRWVTSRFTGRVYARREQQQTAGGAAGGAAVAGAAQAGKKGN